METATYILTAELDSDSFAWLDGLRRDHFPPERNWLPAHLTIFHRLTQDRIANLRRLTLPRAPINVRFSGLRSGNIWAGRGSSRTRSPSATSSVFGRSG